jgi:hypothetical protein
MDVQTLSGTLRQHTSPDIHLITITKPHEDLRTMPYKVCATNLITGQRVKNNFMCLDS